MISKRIIPCLDLKDGRVVKGVNFVDLTDAGDPVETAKVYNAFGADEIVFLDITASYRGASPMWDQREKIENYLCRVVYDLLFDVVCELSKDYYISLENKQYIANFYKHGFVGIILEWVKCGMKEDPKIFVSRVSQMIHGQLLLAIKNMAETPILSKELE